MEENNQEEAFMPLYRSICSYSASHEKTMRDGSHLGEMLKQLHSVLRPYQNISYKNAYDRIYSELINNARDFFDYRINSDIYLDTLYDLLNQWISSITDLLENKGFIKLNEGW